MSDTVSRKIRRRIMQSVRSKDTGPELTVRKFLHKKGFRYSLHRKDLPGKPDIVLRKYKTIIFVNGCFWHRHEGCQRSTMPKTNTNFWEKKFHNTVNRDKMIKEELLRRGWNVLVIWECELKTDPDKILEDLARMIKPSGK